MLSAGGATILNLGTNLMKRSHMLNSARPASERKFYATQPQWLAGFAVFILGNVFDFVALSMAAQSIIAPLGAVSLISNIFFATAVLGERFHRRDAAGTGLVVVGAVLSVVFGDHEDRHYEMADIQRMVRSWPLVFYWVVCAVVSGCFLAAVPLVRRAVKRGDPLHFVNRHLRLQPLLHVTIGGIVGAQTLIGAKILSELLASLKDRGTNPFTEPGFYAILAFTAGTAVTQIHQMQLALRLADALFCVPAFFAVWTMASLVGAGIFFNEFASFTGAQMALFPLGVGLTFWGVFLLSARLRPDDVVNDVAPTGTTVRAQILTNRAEAIELGLGSVAAVRVLGDPTHSEEIEIETMSMSHEDDGGMPIEPVAGTRENQS